MNKRSAQLIERIKNVELNNLYLSAVTVAELKHGVYNSAPKREYGGIE